MADRDGRNHAHRARPAPAAERGPLPGLAAVVLTTAAGMAVLLLALLAGGGGPRPVVPGLPDAGAVTGWALPMFRLMHDVAAVGTVGSLLTGVVLAANHGEQLSPHGYRAVRAASWWALGWVLTALATLVLSLSDIAGVPLGDVLTGDVLSSYAWSVQQGRAMALVAALALVVAACARWTLTTAGGALLLLTAVVAVLPPAYTGHSVDAANHTVATWSLVVHVVAATLWVGGLIGLVVHLRRSGAALATAVPRFSALALGCFVAVGASGLVNAYTRLDAVSQLWTSGYGWLLVGKAAALLALGGFGAQHRRRTVAAVVAQRPRGFLRLATVEVAVMICTIALAVALTRTPPPPPVQQAPVTTAPPGGAAWHDVEGSAGSPVPA